VKYTTIQNWSKNIFNLVTKRALARSGATVSWIDGNFGSKVTMKYPCIVLAGERARGEIISLSVASHGQELDAGGKIIHVAPNTTSQITSKSLCSGKSVVTYRGLVKIGKKAANAQALVTCDTLFLDNKAISNTIPVMHVQAENASSAHEASISMITPEQLFYLQSRGFTVPQAHAFLINGFIESFVQLLPMEYAVEINNLIQHDMEGSVG
jgi:Fe-S cluster assembly protein SufB